MYIRRMRPPFPSRVIALAWALLVAMSVPGLAVAHGTAHRGLVADADHGHTLDHRSTLTGDHAHDVATDASIAEHSSIRDVHDPADHAHLEEMSAISSVRVDLPAFAAAEAVDVRIELVLSVVDTPSFTVASSVGASPLDSPRQPRAPPLG